MPGTERRNKRPGWVALALIILGCVVFWVRTRPDELARASAAYERGDWVAASSLAKDRLKAAPGDMEALRVIARSAARQRHDKVAGALYARLGGASALKAEDFFLMGKAMERAGDVSTARECWTSGLLADPSHPEILREFALISLAEAKPVRASMLAAKLATRPGWEVRGGLLSGEIAYGLKMPDQAADFLRAALDRDPLARDAPHPPAWYRRLLARSLLQTGRHAEAAGQLRPLLATGHDPEASWLLSRSFLQAQNPAHAEIALSQSAGFGDVDPSAPEPSPYVGSARCASCHATIHRDEQNSLHARTFRKGTGLDNFPIPDRPVPDPARPDVRHTLSRSGGELRYETTESGKTDRAIVDYLFGSGAHGVTLVGRDEAGRSREFRLSRYADGANWDVTTGHPRQPPPGEGHLGRLLTDDDVRNCLVCHTTAARPKGGQAGPEAADRGIGCETCHGPGGNHLQAVASHVLLPAIARPKAATAAQVVALCGRCHGPLGKTVTAADPFAVRFPAVGLTWSRCYTESNGALDCTTCHDPHRDAEKSPTFYDAKCLTCHRPDAAPTSTRTACPVNPAHDCLTCHMPPVRTAIPHSTFTDHHIRTRPDGSGSRPK